MKRIVVTAILLCGMFSASSAFGDQDKATEADKSLRAAGEGICAAGMKGDAGLLMDFFFHPAMMKKALEAAGFESEQQMRDFAKAEMERELKEDELEKCVISEAIVKECAKFEVEYFSSYELIPAKCGTITMLSKEKKDDKERNDTIDVGLIDGKWYVVLSAPAPEEATGEEAGLDAFAHTYCAAVEGKDAAAVDKLAVAGIKQPGSAQSVKTLTWAEYVKRISTSWAMDVEPVTCTVSNVRSFGDCDALAADLYAAAGYKDAVCGKIELSVFMDKDMWVNTVGAVRIGDAWHADASTFVSLRRASDGGDK